MKVEISVDQAKKLYTATNVLEWEALTTEAKDDLRHLGVSKDDFNELMYHLYDQTCVVAQ